MGENPPLTLTNDRGTLFGKRARSRVVTDYVAADIVLMRLPQWILDDLELRPRVAWVEEDGHKVIRYSLDAEIFGRRGLAAAKLGDDVVVLDRLTMMSLGVALDGETGALGMLPEPYLRT